MRKAEGLQRRMVLVQEDALPHFGIKRAVEFIHQFGGFHALATDN